LKEIQTHWFLDILYFKKTLSISWALCYTLFKKSLNTPSRERRGMLEEKGKKRRGTDESKRLRIQQSEKENKAGWVSGNR